MRRPDPKKKLVLLWFDEESRYYEVLKRVRKKHADLLPESKIQLMECALASPVPSGPA